MAFELNVYTLQSPLPAANIIGLAAKDKLQLRFVVPFKCIALDQETLKKPLKKQDLMVYCWAAKDDATTDTLDKALVTGDQKAILSVQEKIGWFDFRCERYDYEKFWKKYPDERAEFEKSSSAETLIHMRSAKVRYFFRCGLRPKQNIKYVEKVAKIVGVATDGYVGA